MGPLEVDYCRTRQARVILEPGARNLAPAGDMGHPSSSHLQRPTVLSTPHVHVHVCPCCAPCTAPCTQQALTNAQIYTMK